MSRTTKILQQMANNPNDWRIQSFETVAKNVGIEVRRPGGSHVTFSHPDSELVVTVPAHRPIKPVYVRRFLKLVDAVKKGE